MKIDSQVLTIPFIILLWSCGNPSTEESQSNVDQEFTLEVTDSLVVDYIGLLSWSHISPDSRNFLAMDLQKSSSLTMGEKSCRNFRKPEINLKALAQIYWEGLSLEMMMRLLS
jgi:hypothetical protein